MIIPDYNLINEAMPGEEAAITGNAAIARALIESSVKVITSYPGAPCAEIIENLAPFCDTYNFHLEWSVNEKVAFEVAAAAAMAGVRSAFITKYAGMNVAADSLISINYSGINSGMVIISADDPGAFNSCTEQDTRLYAQMAQILGMDPSSQQEAKDMVIEGFKNSEKAKLPVFVRATNRILYGRGRVIFGQVQNLRYKAEFEKDNMRWLLIGKNAPKRHKWLYGQQQLIKGICEVSNFNRIEWAGKKKYGIITGGISFYYVKEAIRDLSMENEVSILKLGCFNPPAEDYIKEFLGEMEEVLVVEEMEPVIEEDIKIIALGIEKKVKIYGKLTRHLPREDHYSPDIIKEAINKIWPVKNPVAQLTDPAKERLSEILPGLPQGSITFCPGCPHRASFFVLRKSIESTDEKFIISGDLGCYILGAAYPFNLIDTAFCMGASIGIGSGLYQAGVSQRIIATIGDSTFLHSGIPGLINCCYTNVDILIYIMENKTIAMTGLQPYPGTGIDVKGQAAKIIDLEDIVKACKPDYLEIIDPFSVDKSVKILSKALRMKGQRVVIARHECAQSLAKHKKENKNIKPCKIIPQRCIRCMVCVSKFGCPAIFVKDNEVVINKILCTGCGLCIRVCPCKAIVSAKV